jgi:hypothetical protein
MIAMRLLSAAIFLGAVVSCSISASNAQETPQPAPETPAHAARAPYSPFKTFFLDDTCRLLPDPAHRDTGKKKPHLHSDPVICHLEGVANSEHIEETIVGNELHRNMVSVSEQTYVLQNITTDPAIFEIEHFVPLGWSVDSDPKPDQMNGSTAIFHPHAQPGEIVHLHVGLRQIKPLKTKIVKTPPVTSAQPQGN